MLPWSQRVQTPRLVDSHRTICTNNHVLVLKIRFCCRMYISQRRINFPFPQNLRVTRDRCTLRGLLNLRALSIIRRSLVEGRFYYDVLTLTPCLLVSGGDLAVARGCRKIHKNCDSKLLEFNRLQINYMYMQLFTFGKKNILNEVRDEDVYESPHLRSAGHCHKQGRIPSRWNENHKSIFCRCDYLLESGQSWY